MQNTEGCWVPFNISVKRKIKKLSGWESKLFKFPMKGAAPFYYHSCVSTEWWGVFFHIAYSTFFQVPYKFRNIGNQGNEVFTLVNFILWLLSHTKYLFPFSSASLTLFQINEELLQETLKSLSFQSFWIEWLALYMCHVNGTEHQRLPPSLGRDQAWILDMRVFKNNRLNG